MPLSHVFNEYEQHPALRESAQEPLAEVLELSEGMVYARDLSCPEIIFITGSRVTVLYLRTGIMEIEAGNFLLALPGDFVSLTAEGAASILIFRLKADEQIYHGLGLSYLNNFMQDDDKPLRFLPVNEEMGIFMDGFVPFLRKGFTSRVYDSAKISELLYILRETYNRNDLALFFSPLTGDEFAFRTFVYSNISKVRSVGELAVMANLSPTGFRSKFIRIMGCTPSEMLIAHKAEMIRNALIYTDRPLKEIGEKFGFNSIYVFSRFCKKHLGQSPGSIRKSGREGRIR